MNYRSTNTIQGGSAFGGALVIGGEAGSGVEINPNSSGNAPNIQPCGDETNKGITLQSKGTGTITIGSSANQPVVITSTNVTIAGGGKIPIINSYTVEFTAPTLSSGLASAAESTYTVAGVSTGTVLVFTPTNPISALYTVRARCSTVNELVLAWGQCGDSTLGSGESTNRGVLVQFKF